VVSRFVTLNLQFLSRFPASSFFTMRMSARALFSRLMIFSLTGLLPT
jgi:hypothetical protein